MIFNWDCFISYFLVFAVSLDARIVIRKPLLGLNKQQKSVFHINQGLTTSLPNRRPTHTESGAVWYSAHRLSDLCFLSPMSKFLKIEIYRNRVKISACSVKQLSEDEFKNKVVPYVFPPLKWRMGGNPRTPWRRAWVRWNNHTNTHHEAGVLKKYKNFWRVH